MAKKKKSKWFDFSAFDDGYDFGDITKTIKKSAKKTRETLQDNVEKSTKKKTSTRNARENNTKAGGNKKASTIPSPTSQKSSSKNNRLSVQIGLRDDGKKTNNDFLDFLGDAVDRFKERDFILGDNAQAHPGFSRPESTLFKKGAFEDGFQTWDLNKAASATTARGQIKIGEGLAGIVEHGVVDPVATIIGGTGKLFGADEFAEKTKEFVKRDLVKEVGAGKAFAWSTNPGAMIADKILNKNDKGTIDASLLGNLGESGLESAGTLGGAIALGAVGVNPMLTMGMTSAGSEVQEAFQNDATYGEAITSGVISGVAEAAFEILGGIKLGGKALDEGLKRAISKKISNKVAKVVVNAGMDATAEGIEEIATTVAQRFGKAITYEDETTVKEFLSSDEAIDEYIESAVTGYAMGLGFGSAKAGKSLATGRDYNTGLTDSEQKVVDREVEDRVNKRVETEIAKRKKAKVDEVIKAEIEKKSEKFTLTDEQVEGIKADIRNDFDFSDMSFDDVKVTKKERAKIEEQVRKALDRGEIDTFTIEDTLFRDNALRMRELSREKQAATPERQAQIDEELNALNEEYNDIIEKNGLLKESYRQKALESEALDYKLDDKASDKAKKIVQSAVESGMNNTRRSHERLDMVIKMADDSDLDFIFTNDAELEQLGHYKDVEDLQKQLREAENEAERDKIRQSIEDIRGKRSQFINGFAEESTRKIFLNVESGKVMEFISGHEVTHFAEKMDAYDSLATFLKGYAEKNGEFKRRMDEAYINYYGQIKNKSKEAQQKYIEQEVTADLVGEYIFNDQDFISELSAKEPNIFMKAYDYIKHVYKMATAGSAEARQLEQAKRMFDKAYKQMNKAVTHEGKSNSLTEADSNTRFSLVEDQKTIDFLENQDYIVTYKSMQLIDGKLYPPMSAEDKGTDGKKKLRPSSVLGRWQQADENPGNIKKFAKEGYGKYVLHKGNKKSIEAAYNPYEHSSNLVLNDQFEEAYQRPNLVTVECHIPVSEMTSGYKAQYAKDPTGMHDWKAGVVANKIKDNKRKVYLTRWLKPVRVLDDAEVAQKYKEILGEDVSVPFNVVSPSLLAELEKAGVKIDYEGSPMYKSIQKRKQAKAETKYSISDTKGRELTKGQQEKFKDSKMRDENGNLMVMYHGSENAGFHTFDNDHSDDGRSFFFTDDNTVAKSYSGTHENYVARTFKTVDDINNFFAENGLADEYEIKEEDGKYVFYDNGDAEATSDTLDGIYEEFKDWTGLGRGSANYEVYLDIKNPLVVDADGNYWDELEFPDLGESDDFTTRDISSFAKSNGYDGVIFKNIKDNGLYAAGVKERFRESTVAIVFDSNQIKSVANENPTSDPDIRYSITDNLGNELSPAVQKRFEKSKVRDEDGDLKVVYHGTASGEFFIFDREKGNAEGDFGRGFYFSDDEGDMELNYEGGGPDLEVKIARRAEQIEMEEDIDYDEAEARAREELDVGANRFEVYLNMENPAIVGKTILLDQESFMEQYDPEDFDSEDDYYAEVDQFVADEIDNIAWEVDRNLNIDDVDELKQILFEAYYEGGIGVEDLKERIGELAFLSEEGDYIGNEITRQVIESLGYDGIIDPTVSTKFRNMNMTPGTTHYIVFKPNQIKNITNENPTDNPDIRFSISEDDIAPVGRALTEEDVAKRDAMTDADWESLFKQATDSNIRSYLDNKEKPKKPVDTKEPAYKVVSSTKKRKHGLGSAWDTFQTQFVNRNRQQDKLAKETGNKEIKWKGDRVNNIAAEIGGDIFTAQTDNYGNAIGKALDAPFEQARKAKLEAEFDDYLKHQSNIERHAIGRGSKVPAETSEQYVKAYEEAYTYKDDKGEKHSKFKEWAKDVHAYNQNLLKNALDGGLITYDDMKRMTGAYGQYVPFYSAETETPNIDTTPDEIRSGRPIKRAIGGAGTSLQGVEQAMMKQTYSWMNAIAKNDLYKEILKSLGGGVQAPDVRTAENPHDLESSLSMDTNGVKYLTAYIDGEAYGEAISDELFAELKRDLDTQIKDIEEKYGIITKPLQKVSQLRGKLLTTYNPGFIVTNPIKDVQDALLNSKYTMRYIKNIGSATTDSRKANSVDWYAEQFKEQTGQDIHTVTDAKSLSGRAKRLYKSWLDGTTWNRFVTSYGNNATQLEYSDDTDINLKKSAKKAKNKGFLNKLGNANNFMEIMFRYPEFKATLEKGKSFTEALYNAREVTTNFGRGGTISKAINRNGATFFNTSVQGMDKFFRNFSFEDGAKGFVSAVAKSVVLGMTPAMLNHILLGGGYDDEYEALPEYVKSNYYLFRRGDGEFIRIPKGRMISVLGSAARLNLEASMGKVDPTIAKEIDNMEFLRNAMSQIGASNPLKENIFAPVIQAVNNEAWYGGDLVPTRLSKLPREEQYDASTDEFSKWLGEKLPFSPYKINYVLDQYSGGVGDILLPMITPEATSGAETFGDFMLAPIKDKFVVNSTDDNKYVGELYDLSDVLKTRTNSSEATLDDVLQYEYISDIASQMGELYALKRDIQNDDTLSKSQKYEETRKVQATINDLAEEGVRNYRSGASLDIAYETNPDAVVSKVYPDYNTYKSYRSDIWSFKADKDENGKTIRGSKQDKIIDYLNESDMDYGERIILFRQQYPTNDTYNEDIIDYLNSRDDLYYEDVVIILESLGMKVREDGTVEW